MPVRINCPSCQASMSMPESMYGKAVRCPKCQSPFQCPSGPSAAAPARRRSAPASSGGNPFSFEESAAAADVEEGYGGDSRQPAFRGRRGAWERVNSGFLFLFLSAFCFFLCLSELVLLPLLLDSRPGETAVKIQEVCFVLLLLAALVLGVLGLLRCSAVPAVSGGKAAVTVATVFMIIATLLGFVVSFLIVKKTFWPPKTPEEFRDFVELFKYYSLFWLILDATLLTSFILSVFFILLTALSLQDKTLAGTTMAYAVVVVTSPLTVTILLFFAATAAAARGGAPGSAGGGGPDLARIMAAEGVWKYLPFLVVFVIAGWFSLLLLGLKRDINRAARRGAA